MLKSLLQNLGLNEKAASVYLGLLQLGPSSVRTLAEHIELNRGSTYDALKFLQEEGLVTLFESNNKQHFLAASPERLRNYLDKQDKALHARKEKLQQQIPELLALYHRGGERPIAKYYRGKDIVNILEDILETCEFAEEPVYRVYSSEKLRPHLYQHFPTFSDVRIAKNIRVKVIAIGDGGSIRGLDERRWIAKDSEMDKSTYILIYEHKTAYISLDAKNEPVGVVIENEGVYDTQRLVFDKLWESLET